MSHIFDSWFLAGARLCFLGSFCYTLLALRAERFRPSRFNLISIGCGFLLLTVWLWIRGEALKACPITNFHEVLIFLSWGMVLIYLVVGPAYRLSLMGAFTSLLVLAMLIGALFFNSSVSSHIRGGYNGYIEFHAALSLIAYGAFGLACIAGIMYLIQEKHLKTHRASLLFYNLPPISDLSIANIRLLWLGFGVLTVAFVAGFLSHGPIADLKFGASLCIWLLYGAILTTHSLRPLAAHRMASVSIAFFLLAMISLPGIYYLSISMR